jgi:CBS domain-containing protein
MEKLTASDIMNRDVKTVTDDTTLTEVAGLLIANDISGLPVVDKNNTIVGMISEADLMDEKRRRSAIPKLALFGLYTVSEKLLEESYQEGCSLEARDMMTKRVITASPDTPIENLAEIMVRKRINRIPIIDEGKLVGIVSRADILRGHSLVACNIPTSPDNE